MSLFGKAKAGGFMDVIRCDEPSYLIWKWHPEGSQRGNNNRENAIRWGSSIRVKDGEIAVFVYQQKDGTVQDFIEGPCDKVLETENLPILANIIGLAYNGDSPFQAEVYFINTAKIVQVPFAVPYFDIFDPRFLDFGVPTAVRGKLTFNITNCQEFIRLHRLNDFNLDTFQVQIRDAMSRYVKSVVANAPADNNIPVVQIERAIADINNLVEANVRERFERDFGVNIVAVDIATIEIDKSSYGYQQLKTVTADLAAATAKAQTEANIKNIKDMQRINAENLEESLRIQREEAQYAQHKQTQSDNFGAYQTEAQTQVGVAGANALGQMGANGAGGIDLGNGGGGGFNPAAMMAGVALGSAVGQNIAGTMNNAMSGVQNTGAAGTPSQVTPPPVPEVVYHVAEGGQPTGPFNKTALGQMITNGKLTVDSLVWKPGMAEWASAGTVDELKTLFDQYTIPPIS